MNKRRTKKAALKMIEQLARLVGAGGDDHEAAARHRQGGAAGRAPAEEPRVTVYLIATEAETYVHIPRKRQEDEIGGILA